MIAAMWDAGCLGVESRAAPGRGRVRLEAWFPGRATIGSIGARVRGGLAGAGLGRTGPASLRRVPDGRWVEAWQRTLRPMRIGGRFLAVPEECEVPARSSRLVLRIPFGQAFGTGEHASTRLSLGLLETCLSPGERVVDLGTGTGILALAAHRMGAGTVVAVDSDPVAVRVARETMRRNRVRRGVRLVTGEAAGALRRGRFDLALVNIGATVIAALMPAIARALAPGGRAVLAGILARDEAPVGAAARASGLRVLGRRRSGPWSALLVGRPARP